MMKKISISILFLGIAILLSVPSAANAESGARLDWLTIYCNDIDEMRHFYSDLLGLETGPGADEEGGGFQFYVCGDFVFMIMQADTELPVNEEFMHWLGFSETGNYNPGWSIQIPSEDFEAVVARLQDEGVKAADEEPMNQMDAFMQYIVLDPMGNSVELYSYLQDFESVWDMFEYMDQQMEAMEESEGEDSDSHEGEE
ncbi:MAG TPA: VOC family protein [bacterium]|jgi:extradiol dioxygenase family protein